MPYGQPIESDIEEIHKGIEEQVESFAEEVCNVKRPTQLSGDVHVDDLATLLGGSGESSREDFRTAPGADAEKKGSETKEVPFSAHRHEGLYELTAEEIAGEEALGVSAQERYVAKARMDSNYKIDGDLAFAIREFFDERSTQADWDDGGSSSKPLDTLKKMIDASEGDTVVAGQNALSAMTGHPAFQGVLSNDERESDSAVITAVEGWDRRINTVTPFEKRYNINEEGQQANIGHLFSNYIAVFRKQDLVMVDPNHRLNPEVDTDSELLSKSSLYNVCRWVDFVTGNGLGEWAQVVNT